MIWSLVWLMGAGGGAGPLALCGFYGGGFTATLRLPLLTGGALPFGVGGVGWRGFGSWWVAGIRRPRPEGRGETGMRGMCVGGRLGWGSGRKRGCLFLRGAILGGGNGFRRCSRRGIGPWRRCGCPNSRGRRGWSRLRLWLFRGWRRRR